MRFGSCQLANSSTGLRREIHVAITHCRLDVRPQGGDTPRRRPDEPWCPRWRGAAPRRRRAARQRGHACTNKNDTNRNQRFRLPSNQLGITPRPQQLARAATVTMVRKAHAILGAQVFCGLPPRFPPPPPTHTPTLRSASSISLRCENVEKRGEEQCTRKRRPFIRRRVLSPCTTPYNGLNDTRQLARFRLCLCRVLCGTTLPGCTSCTHTPLPPPPRSVGVVEFW